MPSSRLALATSSAVRSRLNSSSGTPRYTTFTFAAGISRARTTKSAVLFETASAMSVAGSRQPVGDLLIPRRVGQVGVLVHDGRNPPQRPDEAAEGRGAVAVQVQDVDLLGVDDAEQRRERARIELRSLEIRDVDAQRVERLFREVLLSQADQRDTETVAVEPRNHPAEEALDAVHPRPFPPEVVADLEDVQRSVHSGRCSRQASSSALSDYKRTA